MSIVISEDPAPQTDWNKLYKLAPLVIVLMYMRTQEKPVTQTDLADALCIDRKTAANNLRQLASNGCVAQIDHNNGYILVDGGRQMLLDLDTGWGIFGHPPLKESLIKDFKGLKIKKERKKGMGIFWTAPEGLTTERILDETGRLFGHKTISFGVDHRAPSFAMALVAHAYDQRDGLDTPQIFVYRRLQKETPPDKKYLLDPLAYLPNDYLHALGLAELQVVEVQADEFEDRPAAPVVSNRAVQTWSVVQGQLQDMMARGDYNTWVRDARAIDLTEHALKVAVCNDYSRDWLDSRLASTINRLLIGIFNSDAMHIEFVVSVAVETEA